MRRVLDMAGLPSDGPIEILTPSQYPTARATETGVVVSVYPEHWGGPEAWAVEVEAHEILDASGMPVPRIVARGELFSGPGRYSWPWLIETEARGLVWSRAVNEMSARDRLDAARRLGSLLARWHRLPCGSGPLLGTGWDRFLTLATDELINLGSHDGRLDFLPPQLHEQLKQRAAETLRGIDRDSAPRLVHGDLFAENVFVDPATGALTIIDLNEMYAGHPWYDLADVCFRLLHGERGSTVALLEGYGLLPDGSTEDIATGLLGWALLHDFDIISPVATDRLSSTTAPTVRDLACELTGL